MARPIYYQWCQCQLCTYRGVGMSENLGVGEQSGHVMGLVLLLLNSSKILLVNCLPAPNSAGPDFTLYIDTCPRRISI